jgi:hypothetical protein
MHINHSVPHTTEDTHDDLPHTNAVHKRHHWDPFLTAFVCHGQVADVAAGDEAGKLFINRHSALLKHCN